MDLIEIFDSYDKVLFLLLNGAHTPWADPVIKFMTTTWAWLPVYAFFIFKIIKNYRYHSIAALLSIALLITITDKFSSAYMKPTFKRLRPCYEPTLQHQVHNPYGCGGEYGFISSHAANTFGAAMFLFLLFCSKMPYLGFIFIWPTVVSYTRIYLGVHYPLDVLAGGLWGVVSGSAVYYVLQLVYLKRQKTI